MSAMAILRLSRDVSTSRRKLVEARSSCGSCQAWLDEAALRVQFIFTSIVNIRVTFTAPTRSLLNGSYRHKADVVLHG